MSAAPSAPPHSGSAHLPEGIADNAWAVRYEPVERAQKNTPVVVIAGPEGKRAR